MKKTIRFDYTGDVQTLEIPQHIKSIYIEAYGAQGQWEYGGKGGKASGEYFFKDTDSRILNIYAGGQDGYNGGGKSIPYSGAIGGSGGGASDVRINGLSLNNRIIVAGGGGGQISKNRNLTSYGGNGGGLKGVDGQGVYTGSPSYTITGKGATQGSSGTGGNSGAFGLGGDGKSDYIQGNFAGAGAGGGGWYGGGGAYGTCCGGGGSSYINLVKDGTTESGVNSGNGYVIISYFDTDTVVDYEYSGQMSQFVIQDKGVYKIECWGASGGGPSRELSGLGAYSVSYALLEKDDVLKILVPSQGEWDGYRGGGGGGAFVELQPGISADTATLLCATGGGGGSLFGRTPNNYSHGQSSQYSGNYKLNGLKTNLGYGGSAYAGGGGGGYIGNGGGMTCTPSSHAFAWVYGGSSFKNGGTAGYATISTNAGGYAVDMSSSPKGGFGGGGTGSFYRPVGWMGGVEGFYYNGAGGGGGYTGGDSTRDGYANTAGGGSSYFISFKNNLNSYALSGYEEMPQVDESMDIGNFGDGHVRISLESTPLYFLIKDGKNYLPTYDHFDSGKNAFIELEYTDLLNIFEEKSEYYTYLNINDTFKKDGVSITPTDYIDFKECKLGVISDDNIPGDKVNYIPYEINLSKSNIKLKEQIKDVIYKDFVDIESPDKNYSEYITSYNNKYKNCSILNTEILKNFSYFAFRFNDPKGKISKIQMERYDNLKLTKIEKRYFECKSDLLTTSITFNKNYNKVLINKLTKQKFKYSTDRLETF